MSNLIKQLLILSVLTLVLVSCPQPLTRSIMDKAKDLTPPEITILSPSENSSYSRTIQIQGVVTDMADASGTLGKVESLSWEILTLTLPAEAALETDGSFLIEYETTLDENIVLSLIVTDWNGNSSEIRLPLVYEGNDIPSFAISPGNRQVELTWDNVPGVENYTLYIEASALAPTVASLNQITNVTSPFVADSLKDGTVYSFLLEGSSSSGPDNYSSIVRGVPLSTYHLFPRVESNFNHIEVEWRALDGINTYEVMRSTSPGGPFSSVSGPINGNTYSDGNVQQGEVYYYGVKPSQYCDIISEIAEGRVDPFPPYKNAEVAHYTTPDSPRNSAVKDNFLFIADYSNGLHVADITVPSVPLPVSTLPISGAKDLAISGNTAYVTGGNSLYVVDITDPYNPSLSGSIVVTTSQAEGVDVEGSRVSVGCFNDGFSLVDVSDPANPTLAYHENKTGGIYDLGQVYSSELKTIFSSLYLFISNNSSTSIYRVTGTPAAPILQGQTNSLPGSDQIAVSDNGLYAYLASSWYIRSYQLTNLSPLTFTFRDELDPSPEEPVQGIAIDGTRAYITMRDVGFATIDITDPNNLSELIMFTTPGEARGITVEDGYAYVSNGYNYGLHIFGVAEPDAPTLLTTYTSLTGPTDLAIQGDFLFITETSNDWEMEVLNISNPANPTLAGGTDSYTPVGMKVVGQKIFFAAERHGTMMYDISNPSVPDVLPPFYVSVQGGYANAIDVLGQYSVVVTQNSMLNVFDLSWTDNISAAGAVTIGTGTQPAEDVVFKGNYAFVANSNDDLRVVDLTDPKWPSTLATIGYTAGKAEGLDIFGDVAYVADTINGLYTFDISNPEAITPLYSLGAGPGATDVIIRGDYAILACGASGIRIYNVSDPAIPVLTLIYGTITADKILLVGDILYALDHDGGNLHVIDILP